MFIFSHLCQFIMVFYITIVSMIDAYQPSSSSSRRPSKVSSSSTTTTRIANAFDDVKTGFATVALSTVLVTTTTFFGGVLLPVLPAFASDSAAQISLDRLPPTSISIQIGDLPVVGSLLSGTYSKVADGSIKDPSITIKSPKDKVKAISSIATGGHLEFDVGGKLNTHLDVDIAADEAGTARVVVKSNLIPKLPFKNMANVGGGNTAATIGGKESQWNIVTNLGNGESYYYNAKSGVTQFDRPDKL